MYKLAVFDIDGTLATKGNEVPKTALCTIEKLKKNGIHCLIATGRERENMLEILEITGIENFIACNGHYVKYKNETLYRYTYPKKVMETVQKLCEKDGYYYGFSSGTGMFIPKFDALKKELIHPFLEKIKTVEIIEGSVENIVLFAKDGGSEFKILADEYNLVAWGNGMYDMMKIGRSKAAGIEEIRAKLGVRQEEIICFGDGLNDLEMIEYAGLGVAMGDAREELKEIADHITDTAANDGIYKACKKFGLI